LYNTLTKKEEEFKPIKEGQATMYTCGPTVYGRPHIGNYSSFLMADLLARWLEVSGYKVTHVKNITDVGHLVADQDEGEDKIEKQAKQEKSDPLKIAKKYEAQYLEDEKALNMREPEHRPRATETIKEMISITEDLVKKENAYETEDGIYFSVQTFAPYGALSGNTLDNLDAGARIDVSEGKKHPADFALWKKCVGENAEHILRWESPWGEGFPGWHIECSAMSTKFLGEQIDIHTGGEDNIFPHHECEIAQSECASGKKPFVRMWVHRRMIDMGKEKMSKSLGNILTLPDIVEMGFSPLDLRYYFLSVHYRTNLKFTKKGLEDSHKARRKVVEWIGEVERSKEEKELKEKKEFLDRFDNAMNSDLNAPEALAVVFDAMSWSRSEGSPGALKEFASKVRNTFGCFELEEAEDVPAEVSKLLDQRQKARDSKDFETSDKLRDQIGKLGWEVRDSGEAQEAKKL
tara:strand:+ start:148 stop:1533 length:1386 start_codon:yes stop_codon:yes gene_type:complete